ncbi:MAG: Rod binding domain-containing protein [Planctomycetaceae bacterium]|jgi:Rod binding domain-containing protein
MTDPIQALSPAPPNGPLLPEAFDQFVGDTFFRQMLKSLRSTTGKPAYFHGGQAEEIFQSQLDELLITDMVKATKDSFSADLFKQQFPQHVTPGEQTPKTPPPDASQPTAASHYPTTPTSPMSKFDKDA